MLGCADKRLPPAADEQLTRLPPRLTVPRTTHKKADHAVIVKKLTLGPSRTLRVAIG